MAERADQQERDRRKAYLAGYKAGIDDFYKTLPRSPYQRTAFQELLMFHDHDLMLWSQRDLTQPVQPPKKAIVQLQE